MSISDVVQHRDFKSAQKIMAEVKKSKIMESLLDLSDTEVLRKLFETELAQPSNKEVKLLHRALNKLWEELMCNIAKYSFDHDILLFLCEREKVKARILDVMLTCPQNLPDSWGGRRMCACVEGSSIRQLLKSLNREDVSVIPSPITQKKVDEKKEDGEKKAVEKQEDKVKSPVKKEVDSKKVTETEAAKKGTEKKVLEREDVEIKDKDQEENKKEKRLEKAGEEKKKEKKLEKSDEEKKKDKKMEKPEEDKKKEKKLEKSGEERKKEKNVEKAEEDKKKTDLKDNLKKEIEEKEEPPKKVMKVRKMQSTEKPRGAVLVKQKQASEPMGAGEAEKPPEAKDSDGEEKKCVDAKSSALTAKPSEIKREAEEVATRRISSKEQKPIHKAREAALAVIRKMSSKAEPSPVAKRSAIGVRSKKSATGK
ncbi:hypothetical protein GCK32_009887 [Trichostrongylus colubriformis]|uniref:DUF7774 domain-containing protein n=1 Tax=Trichostrongylus colubriformis TaxID=6319 RepID=A0AAN8EXG9_TRICO